MGKADFYKSGDWNFYCHLCGAKQKSSMAMKTWDGFYVCRHHKAMRNPQDKLRGVREIQGLPWSTSRTPDPQTYACSIQGSTAIPGLAVAGCMIPGRTLPY